MLSLNHENMYLHGLNLTCIKSNYYELLRNSSPYINMKNGEFLYMYNLYKIHCFFTTNKLYKLKYYHSNNNKKKNAI